jgi:uncharacterized protein (DUF1697 family)
MARLVALLRAVNLGPHRKVSSAQLVALATGLGFGDARTLINSGNLLFDASQRADTVEKRLEAASAKELGLATDYFVRGSEDLAAVVAGNPFPREATSDPSHLVVVFLKKAATEASVKALRAAIVGRERVEAVGRDLVAYYPDGIGESKVTTRVIEKHVGCAGTGRNWNTVGKLGALLRG